MSSGRAASYLCTVQTARLITAVLCSTAWDLFCRRQPFSCPQKWQTMGALKKDDDLGNFLSCGLAHLHWPAIREWKGQSQPSPVTLLTSCGKGMQPSLVAPLVAPTSVRYLCEALNHCSKKPIQKSLVDTGMMQRTQQDHCKGKEALGRRLTHAKKKGTLAK